MFERILLNIEDRGYKGESKQTMERRWQKITICCRYAEDEKNKKAFKFT